MRSVKCGRTPPRVRQFNTAMLKFINYLHGSELVASFQKLCGLCAVEDEDPTCQRPLVTREYPVSEPGSKDTSIRKRCENGQLNGELTKSGRHDNNSNYKYKTSEYNGVASRDPLPQYQVGSCLLHCLFLLSAELGHELFYISFLPCIHWNLDPFLCRRMVTMWAIVMYIGQVMKDKLKMPRPLSPPVVKLETRVNAEYGMPSTHAMAATSISFTFLLSASTRLQFPFGAGLLLAVTLSMLVGLSRLYTGMHSALDVICGMLISAALLMLTYPLWDAFDHLQLTSPLSPIVALVLALFLCYSYPELDHYSTTRGDTTIIVAVSAGCSMGYWVNKQLGQTYEPDGGFPLPLPALTGLALARGSARFLLGLAVLVGMRSVMKSVSLWLICSWHKVPLHDLNARREKKIEVPYKFSTYITIGLLNTILMNRLFVALNLL
uniref:Sphingosine-1-phosphate phosphatase 2 n=2 Tax=Paramormyrops kingsleyae TaxID=1676925 RepID=A0A3B3SCQ3_9TELE|nr:sphingosine-1-phosphate phosphatase 2 isoform X1 [Paramormyrops kingsleyae]